MTSWRETTSERAQNDLDAFLNAVLPFAEQSLAKRGEFFPFGAAAAEADGTIAMLATDSDLGDQPPSQLVLNALYRGARAEAETRRAVAFVADVRAGNGDAIRVELEHREGTTLVILLPYTRTRLSKNVTLGQMSVSFGERRIWNA